VHNEDMAYTDGKVKRGIEIDTSAAWRGQRGKAPFSYSKAAGAAEVRFGPKTPFCPPPAVALSWLPAPNLEQTLFLATAQRRTNPLERVRTVPFNAINPRDAERVYVHNQPNSNHSYSIGKLDNVNMLSPQEPKTHAHRTVYIRNQIMRCFNMSRDSSFTPCKIVNAVSIDAFKIHDFEQQFGVKQYYNNIKLAQLPIKQAKTKLAFPQQMYNADDDSSESDSSNIIIQPSRREKKIGKNTLFTETPRA
jgi:hypothetical protein